MPPCQGKWRMKAACRFLILFNLIVLPLCEQPAYSKGDGRVSGMVKSTSGIPLSNAVIKIFRLAEQDPPVLVLRSDRRGFFKSQRLNPGEYYLEVTSPGYQASTSGSFTVNPGRTISFEIFLQELIDYISNDEDPRNWELETVMRSSSGRRLIFRDFPTDWLPPNAIPQPEFCRSGSMSIASGPIPYGISYLARPQASQSGISSNFAYTEPLSRHSRMILSGQLDFGGGSFWRLRNTYNYRPDIDHDYRISLGYGRMDINYLGSNPISPQLLAGESEQRQPAVRTLAFGFEGHSRLSDLMAIKYGFDYSRLHYGSSKNFFYPSLQVLLTPLDGWNVRALATSQRLSDSNTVLLPDGELLNVSEPTMITMVDNHVSMSQVRHTEISVEKSLLRNTILQAALYQDRAQGPGFPLMVTTVTPSGRKSHLIELGDDRSSQKGLRITVNQKFLDFLQGSIAYGYGTAATISDIDQLISSSTLDGDFLSYTEQRYQHAITGRIDATIPATKTSLTATVRWCPRNPLTPINWFSDRMDIGTRSTNFEIRQTLPFPEFIAATGQWEFLVDLRNVLNQGKEIITTSDGEIILNRNPRSLRFGLNLNF